LLLLVAGPGAACWSLRPAPAPAPAPSTST